MIVKILWDFFFLIFYFLNYFIYSLKMSFYIIFFLTNENNNQFSSILDGYNINHYNLIIYLTDIFFSLITGYHNIGNIILDLNKIQKNYGKNWLASDIFVLFSLLFSLFEQSLVEKSHYFGLISLFFYFCFKKFSLRLKNLRDYIIQHIEEFENYFSISLLYLKTIFIAHLMGCCWYIIGSTYFTQETWITKANLIDESWISKYITSLYWALVTMLSVGYGDIVPTNNSEKIVCILTMLVGFSVFGYTLGSISDIIQQMNMKNQELKYISSYIS